MGQALLDRLGVRVDDLAPSDLFVQLWATALLFHLFGNASGLTTFGLPFVVDVLLCLSSAAAVFWPRRLVFISVAAGVQIVDGWVTAPMIGNHVALLVLINLALLGSIVWSTITRAQAAGRSWFVTFAPCARLVVLTAYAFMAFSKLNTGFFDRVASCAPIFVDEFLRITPLSIEGQPSLQTAAIWTVVIAELLVPFLLVVTPRWGVPFAVGLHVAFAVDPIGHVFDFSSALVALFLLFWPPFFDSGRQGLVTWRARLLAIGAIGLAVWSVAFAFIDIVAFIFIWPLWLAYGVTVLWDVTRAALDSEHWQSRASEAPRPSRVFWRGLRPVVSVVVFLSVLNGLSPYLELKTNFGWNMYSNLRTEAGETNHFVIPGTLALRDAHRSVVTITATNDEDMQAYVDDNLGLTVQGLQVYLHENPDAELTYSFAGETVVVLSGERPAAIGVPPNVFVQKLGAYRAIELDEEKGCLRRWAPAH